MYRGFVYRMYPNQKQVDQITTNFDCCCFVWNKMLQMMKARYDNNHDAPFLYRFSLQLVLTQFKKEETWLRDADATSLQNVVANLSTAYQRFFKGTSKFPRFKSRRYRTQSYTTVVSGRNVVQIDAHHIRLPKVGIVKVRGGRSSWGKIQQATIRRDAVGRFYVSLLCRMPDITLPSAQNKVGIDFNLGTDGWVTSDGNRYPVPQFHHRAYENLAHWQRTCARRRAIALKKVAYHEIESLEDAKNYVIARETAARIQRHVRNQRLDFAHKLTTQLVRRYDTVIMEKLQIKNISKNHKIAAAVQNETFYQVQTMLAYKFGIPPKQFLKVNPRMTSQLCSNCGAENHRMGHGKFEWFRVREWQCPNCGALHDRDVNAARNILQRGVAQLATE